MNTVISGVVLTAILDFEVTRRDAQDDQHYVLSQGMKSYILRRIVKLPRLSRLRQDWTPYICQLYDNGQLTNSLSIRAVYDGNTLTRLARRVEHAACANFYIDMDVRVQAKYEYRPHSFTLAGDLLELQERDGYWRKQILRKGSRRGLLTYAWHTHAPVNPATHIVYMYPPVGLFRT